MSNDTYKGKSWLDEEKTGRIDDDGNIYEGKSWLDEEKVGRIDDDGNVYKGKSWLDEEKAGRIDKNRIIHEGKHWLTEQRIGRVDRQGNIHSGNSWLSEEKTGRSANPKGGATLLTSENSESSSSRYSATGGGGVSVSGDMHWAFFLAILPAMLLLLLLIFLYEKLLGRRFEESRLGQWLLAPIATIEEHFFATYAIVSLIWFVALNIGPDDSSWGYIAFLSLINPVIAGLIIILTAIVFPLGGLMALIMGEFTDYWDDSAKYLGSFLLFIPYFIAGAILTPLKQKTRTVIGFSLIVGIIGFAVVAPPKNAISATASSTTNNTRIRPVETTTHSAHSARQSSGNYHVIIKSTKSIREAQKTRDKMRMAGYPSQIIQSSNGWYAISLGGYSRPEAKRVLASSKNKGDAPKDAFVMPPRRISKIID